jgi:hypothetical protein
VPKPLYQGVKPPTVSLRQMKIEKTAHAVDDAAQLDASMFGSISVF